MEEERYLSVSSGFSARSGSADVFLGRGLA